MRLIYLLLELITCRKGAGARRELNIMRSAILPLLLILSTVISTTAPTLATDIVYPYTFSNGQILPAGQLNGNFDAVTDVVNGGITNGNIDAAAAISLSKLDLTTIAMILRTTGNPAWAAGVTGDTQPRVALMSQGSVGFGAGSASALDTFLFRTAANTLRLQDSAGTAYGTLNLGALGFINGSTMTLTPATIAADRAITVKDPLGAADLRFANGSFNTNGVIYSDSSGRFNCTATGGSGTKVLTSVAGAAPTFTTYTGGFGGDGSDGALAPSTSSISGQYNATTYTVANGVTLTVNTGTIINATGAVTIGGGASGSVVAGNNGPRGGAAGTTTLNPTPGGGPSGGMSGSTAVSAGAGGAGGSCLGVGGTGGSGAGSILIQPTPVWVPGVSSVPLVGSGGGAGSSNGGGDGGSGGGRLSILAVGAISIAAGATVSSNGQVGSNASSNGGGGGGGSGGVIVFASQTSVTNSGSVTATGGTGGEGAGTGGDGGGGAGGYILFWSPSNTAGSTTVTGGAAGSGGTGGATAGSNGTARSITGTPNLPLLAKIQSNPAALALIPSNELHNREVAALYAKDCAEYLHLCSGSLTETCEGIGDTEALDNAA